MEMNYQNKSQMESMKRLNNVKENQKQKFYLKKHMKTTKDDDFKDGLLLS